MGQNQLEAIFLLETVLLVALVCGVLIIEAKRKSGSLITAEVAIEQGRDVYVVPGNIDSLNSEGTNRLRQEGAKLVVDEKDILEEVYRELQQQETSLDT